MLARIGSRWAGALCSVCLTLAACACLLPALAVAALPGTSIVNQASLSANNLPTIQASVSVRISAVGFLRYEQEVGSRSGSVQQGGSSTSVVVQPVLNGPGSSSTSLVVQPVLCGGNLYSAPSLGSLPALPASYPLSVTTAYRVGEPIFLQVTDASRNLSASAQDLLSLTISNPGTGDNETLILRETTPNSGDFVGFISTTRVPASADCLLTVRDGDRIHATYNTELTDEMALVDPYGVAFDASTGQLLDGAVVTLIDDSSGLPATVLGDAGEPFPSIVTTGSTFSTSALTYTLRPGEFRFPFVAPGRSYHFEVTQANYVFPTAEPDNHFTAAAFAGLVVTTGSRGDSFVAPAGLPLRIDLPLDASTSGLFLVKNAVRSVAAIGDFVPYDVVATNKTGGLLTAVRLQDTLPAGFRYRAGSLKRDGMVQPDPQIAPDGRGLDLPLGDMTSNQAIRVTYVAEATAATPLGAAVNSARAGNAGVQSNVARATVRVREDLMRSRALLAGRVLATASCATADLAQAGAVEGARIYLEDGRYVLTDVRGRWHLDDIRPGTHVLQLDDNGLPAGAEILACERHTRSAGNQRSQFVDVQGGTLWQTDFYIKRPEPLHFRLQEQRKKVELSLHSELVNNGLHLRLHIANTDTELGASELELIMPATLNYRPGSFRLNGQALPDPEHGAGAWRLRLPALVAAADHTVSWEATPAAAARPGPQAIQVTLNAKAGEQALPMAKVESKVMVVLPEKPGRVIIFRPRFASFSTELVAADKRWLDDIIDELNDSGEIRLEVVGHSDNVPVVPRVGRLINDNYTLSGARAQSVADYLKVKLGLSEERIQALGRGSDEPLADNKTPKGRDSNRRVELRVFAASRVQGPRLELLAGDAGEQAIHWSEWVSAAVEATPAAGESPEAGPAPVDNGIGLLSHQDGEVVADRVQALRVRVDSRLTTQILLDGQPLPEDRLGFRKNEGQTTLMSFVGVDLGEPGPHIVHIKGTDPFGNVRVDQRITVTVASDITRIRLAQSPQNVADGRTPIAVKLELVDASGRLVPAAVDLKLLSGSLQPLVTGDVQRAVAQSAGRISVGTDGLMKFAPVTRSGLYTIEVAYNNAVERIPVYVRPEKREWILVALAEGTLAEKSIRGNMQSAAAAAADDDAWQDGRTAFFAKGQIKGEWLLTMAYDSGRERASAFGGAINPERFYTLYADATDPRFDAPSKEKLYLRIEKDAFYALFGDFDTGMSEVELGRYSRTLTGLKTEYHDARFDVNVFAADTGQGFVRDELRGDGSSGLYRLRSGRILSGSDKIRIESRDRFKSEVVLSSQQMARWADYHIDYETGQVFFKAPVPIQDENFNPLWIVAEYEVETRAGDSLNAGGRAAVKFLGGRGTVGLSTVQEKNGINSGELAALDASYRFTPADTVRLEVADSSVDTVGNVLGSRSGAAQLLEWKRDNLQLRSRVYYREQEAGFGLGQQIGSEDGTRKIGAEGRYQLRQHLALAADIFQQDMLSSGAQRQVMDVRSELSRDQYGYSAGLRRVQESLGASQADRSAEQLVLGGRYQLPGHKLKLRGNLELGFSGGSESTDFPDRLLLGADYQIHRKVQLSLEEEWALSRTRETQTTRMGVQVQPWKGARIGTRLDHETSESGQRLRSGLGLGQSIPLTPAWTLDVGYDRADTLQDDKAPVFNPALPPVFGPAGSSDYWVANMGANYQFQDIKGVARIERRDADDEQRWNLVGGLYRELNPEMAVAVGLTAILAGRSNGDEEENILLRGSLAWRPDDVRWIVLDRLDYGIDSKTSALGAVEGQRLVNNLNASRRWDREQLSLQYGAKFVFATIDGSRYNGYTDLLGVEWRHDLSARWDIGWRNSMLHSWGSGVLDYSYGISVGVTPVKNAWVSLGFNVEGYADADFSAGEYSAEGVYLQMRLKVDQDSIKQIWNNRRGAFASGGVVDPTSKYAASPEPAVEDVSAVMDQVANGGAEPADRASPAPSALMSAAPAAAAAVGTGDGGATAMPVTPPNKNAVALLPAGKASVKAQSHKQARNKLARQVNTPLAEKAASRVGKGKAKPGLRRAEQRRRRERLIHNNNKSKRLQKSLTW